MEIPEEYILQCEKAVEIQDSWEPQNADIVKGDFVGYIQDWNTTLASLERFSADIGIDGKYSWYKKEELIWLPTQVQLQEMYLNNRKYKINCGQMSMFFEDWRHDELMRYGKDLMNWSMGQLWLACVMQKKYNKVWNGEDWVTER